MDMIIPDDMVEACGKVFGGEYDVSYNNNKPIILDIGANVGAFSKWAKYRWSEAIIHAYEPLPQCFEYLTKNTEHLDNVHCHRVAVGSRSETRTIYYGSLNRGMSSFDKGDYTKDYGIDVQVIGADTLPRADIIKCDTEGAEIEILENIQFDPHVILVEYHSMRNRKRLEELFLDRYTLFGFKYSDMNAGTLKFVRTDIIAQKPQQSW